MVKDKYADLVEDRKHAQFLPSHLGQVQSCSRWMRVLEKANATYIGGEVVIGKEAKRGTKV